MGKSIINTGVDYSTQRRSLRTPKDAPRYYLQKLRLFAMGDKYDNTGGGGQWRLYNAKSSNATMDGITTTAYLGTSAPAKIARIEFNNRNTVFFRSDGTPSRPIQFPTDVESDDFTIFVGYINQSNVALTTQRSLLGFNCSNGNTLGINIGGSQPTTRVICNGVNKAATTNAVLSTPTYLAITYTKSTTTLKIFLAGVLDATFTDVTFTKGLTGTLLLGCSNSGGVNYHGYVAFLQTYATAFTDAEVLAQHTNLLAAYSA